MGLPRRSRAVVRFAALVWATALFALLGSRLSSSPAYVAKAAPLRVMAFGDSITAGVSAFGANGNNGGYRGPLAELLERGGYHVTFVGSRHDYSDAIATRAHEGWPGYVIRSFRSDPGPGQLYGALARKAMQGNDPDVVLLMAGTNDLLRSERAAAGYTLPNIVASMDLLLGQIVTAKPDVFVIVAPIVSSPRVRTCALHAFNGFGDATGCPIVNAGLKAIVDGYVSRGYRVSFALDMAESVPRDAAHFPDGIHPSGAGGYLAMAEVWLKAIQAITQPDPTDVAARP